MRKWDPYERRYSADELARMNDRVSADVEASRRRDKQNAEAAARVRARQRRDWSRDVARARAEVIRLEAIPEAKRNAGKLRRARRRLRDLERNPA